jgi:hypothetical protein
MPFLVRDLAPAAPGSTGGGWVTRRARLMAHIHTRRPLFSPKRGGGQVGTRSDCNDLPHTARPT